MDDYYLQLQLIDQQGQILGKQTILFSPAYWYPGQIYIENQVIHLFNDLQPGIYVLNLDFKDKYDKETTSTPLGLLPVGIVLPDDNLNINFANEIQLTGYQLTPGESPDKFQIALNWQALQSMDKNYTVTIQLLDQNKNLMAQVDKPPVGGVYPTSVWQPGRPVLDVYHLELPEAVPNGIYQLVVGVYDYQTMQRLPVMAAPGTDLVTLQQVEINR